MDGLFSSDRKSTNLKLNAREPQAVATEPLATDLPAVIAFLNRNLRPGGAWSIEAEYPNCFRPTGTLPPTHYMRVVKAKLNEQGPAEIAAHALVRPLLCKTPHGVFKIAAIGSVVTDEAYRGRGYSRAVIESCLDLSRSLGAEVAILWSNLFEFYQKLGFAPAGTETIYALNQDLPRLAGLKMIRTQAVSPDALLKLFQTHSIHTFRTGDDMNRNLKIPNSSVYTAWDTNGKLQAYAIEGKGADLGGCIHEWGGTTPALLSLFDFARKDLGKELLIISPTVAQNLNRRLEAAGCTRHQGPLGLMQVLDAESIVSKLNRNCDLKMLGLERLTALGRSEFQAVHLDREIQTTRNGGESAQFLFGNGKAHLTSEKASAMIPFWIWGWDSV